ncbi:hypothetical protein GPECTOR_340g76 [Gonium pectorale]|uniref:BHLH domain-containing protein n=1 Tax=Gonium pectorale TaxID=33097 RepID=A0A150FVK4_GONPE|nr:hypothetical protein GPECTOR_340g76 [Gonium pectorale]|eukprot:KXZ41653.1 hypothetical protein GPECTOR_340g76 [Gonium pectorale]
MSAAATKKACREKARREKLNERFADLARLIDPNGEPKTDKSTILTDAIKYVQQMTVENHQLRQLNKFLEERVSTLERERGQQLYQQSLMMTQMGGGQLMQAGQAMMVGGPAGMMGGAMQGPAMAHPVAMQASAAMASSSGALMSAAPLPAAPTPPLPTLHSQPHQQQTVAAGMVTPAQGGMMMQMPGAVSGMGTAGLGVTVNVAAGAGPSKPIMVNAMPGAMPYQGMYWLPPQMMDSTQDSLLRPPAA